MESRCAVGNILFKNPLKTNRSIFRFHGPDHRKLICHTTKFKDTVSLSINVIVAPGLGSKFWDSCLSSGDLEKYTSKIFLYVTDCENGVLLGNDKYMEEIRNHFGYHRTWVIPVVVCKDATDTETLLTLSTWFDAKCYSCRVAPAIRIHNEHNVTLENGRDLTSIILQVLRSNRWTQEVSPTNIKLGDRVTTIQIKNDAMSMSDVYVGPKSNSVKEEERATTHTEISSPKEQNEKPALQREKTIMKYKGRDPDKDDKDVFAKSVKYGYAPSFHVKVMVLGPNGAGKTTIIKRLQGDRPDALPIPTKCLEINESILKCSKDEHGQFLWEDQRQESTDALMTERIAYAMRVKTGRKRSDAVQENNDVISTKEIQPESHQTRNQQEISLPTSDVEKCKGVKIERSGTTIQQHNDMNSAQEIQSKSHTTETQLYASHSFDDGQDGNHSQTIPSVSDLKADGDLALDSTDIDDQLGEMSYVFTDDQIKEVFVLLEEHSETTKLYFSFWDFAGQAAYYGTHQMFLTPNTVNILVVDLSKDLDDILEDNLGVVVQEFGKMKVTVKESIEFWLQSIQLYTGKSKKHVIVVCTHIDKVPEDQRIERVRNIEHIVRPLVQVEYTLLFLDNTKSPNGDEQLETLKECLYTIGQDLSSKEMLPAIWIEYERVLKKEKLKIVTLARVSELLLQTSTPTEDELQRLQSFLFHQHCRGILLYYPIGTERQSDGKNIVEAMGKTLVVLDPMSIVTFLNRIMSGQELPYEIAIKKGNTRYTGFSQDGVFDETFLENTLTKAGTIKEIAENKTKILEFLGALHVIFKYMEHRDNSINYFMPCLLRQTGQSCKFETAVSKSNTIVIAFQPACSHFSVFFQIVAALSHHYDVKLERGKDGRRHWYRKCACFYLAQNRTLQLHMRMVENDIYIQIINFSEKFIFGNTDEVKFCSGVLGRIRTELENILNLYSTTIDFDLKVTCLKHNSPPTPSNISINALLFHGEYMCEFESSHSVDRDELLKDWFLRQHPEIKGEIRWTDSKIQENVILTDRDIGRVCLLLENTSIKPCCLANRLDIPNGQVAVDRVIQDNSDNVPMQLLQLLFIWKGETNEGPTFGVLARCLKCFETQGITFYSLIEECKKKPSLKSDLSDRRPTDRELIEISNSIFPSRMVFLFLELGISKVKIDIEKKDAGNSLETIFNMFKIWLQSSHSPSLLDIISACHVTNMKQVAGQIGKIAQSKSRLRELNALNKPKET